MSRYKRALEELLKKQSVAEERTSSLTQYLNNCQNVVMDGPVFFLVLLRHPYFMKRLKLSVIANPFFKDIF